MMPDAIRFKIAEFVVRKLRPGAIGQVVAIIFAADGVGYRVQWVDDCTEHFDFELNPAEEPDGYPQSED